MSIPVRFDWYDVDGKLMVANRGYFTISYGEDSSNLTTLLCYLKTRDNAFFQQFIHPRVRYAVPLNASDYMFDLENLSHPWPNKFKEK
jgi:hypothetical protein